MGRWIGAPVFVLIVLAAAARTVPGQDRVVLRRPAFAGRITVSGTIDDYTGTEIAVRSQGDVVRRYPAEEVVSIETTQIDAHDRGLKLLKEDKVDESLGEFETALRKEPRAWVRREILSLLVRTSLRRGDHAGAGSRFLELMKGDSTTRHFRMIPLLWADEPISAAAKSQAKAWMDAGSEPARLIGASLLLDDPAHALIARSTLRQLATSTDRRIQTFAQLQSWRTEAVEGVGDLEVQRWQERVDALPPELRAGPAFVLGRAFAIRHDYELAAATLLWLPLVDDHDYRLSARACYEAGIALGRIGQQAEALRLFGEVSRRYGDSPAAADALRQIKAAAEKERQNATPRL